MHDNDDKVGMEFLTKLIKIDPNPHFLIKMIV